MKVRGVKRLRVVGPASAPTSVFVGMQALGTKKKKKKKKMKRKRKRKRKIKRKRKEIKKKK
jgi:hypothetical protein